MRARYARAIRAGIAASRLDPHSRRLWLAARTGITREQRLAILAFMRPKVIPMPKAPDSVTDPS